MNVRCGSVEYVVFPMCMGMDRQRIADRERAEGIPHVHGGGSILEEKLNLQW